jgi:lipoprotein NlpI
MPSKFLIHAVLAAAALSMPAVAASERDRWDCHGRDPARMVAGCTRVIEDPGETAQERAFALYMRGLAYVAKGDPDRAIADYDGAIRLGPDNGLAFNERALAWRIKGDFDRALSDFDEAARLGPGNGDIHYNRGTLLMRVGDLERAVTDFDDAIRLGPTEIVATAKDDAISRLTLERIRADYFHARGMAKFLQGKFGEAAADYARVAPLHRDDPYPALMLYLARARSGQGADPELQAGSATFKRPDWPFPVVELFLKRKTVAETLAAAKTPEQHCEAQYYVGQWDLVRGDMMAAQLALQTAASTCPTDLTEYQLAQFELKRLPR